MASSNYTSNLNEGFTPIPLTISTASTVSVLVMIYKYIIRYGTPAFVVNALVGNVLIIFLTLTTNFFSQQTSLTVRSYYMAIAVADLITVLCYTLLVMFGECNVQSS